MNTFDLQIQTIASDGRHSPAGCVRMARENGVHTIAITDHDTVAGVAEALAAGRELGIRVIPGIELSSKEHGVHLLGFGIDAANVKLLAELKKAEASRTEGAQQMTENLRAAGFAVEWTDVLAEATGAVVARPHIARAIFKRPENAEKLKETPTMHEFFERHLSEGSPTYVHRACISAQEAIALIHHAGGVAVWSHPPLPDFENNCVGLERFLLELRSYGLDGVEVFNPAHTEADVSCLESLAARYGLLVTGGSDFHERYDPIGLEWPRPASTVGDFPTYGRPTEDSVPRLREAIERRTLAERT